MEIKQFNTDGTNRTLVQIARFDTKGTILDVEDTFSLGQKESGPEFFPKIKLNLTIYGEDLPELQALHRIRGPAARGKRHRRARAP